MKKIFILLLIVLQFVSVTLAQTVRPIKDDVGFCWNPEQMDLFIDWLDDNAKEKNFSSENLVAAISPHDDYLYAGKIYYPLYKLIKAKEIVVFGLMHSTVRVELGNPKDVIFLDEFDQWSGAYSNIKISPLREFIKQKFDSGKFVVSNKAHSMEHSIEALIPLIQHYNKEAKITPIIIPAISFDKMNSYSSSLASIIQEYIQKNNYKLGKDIFFLFSNDANHYGEDFKNFPYGLDMKAHTVATENDKRIVNENLVGEISGDKIKKLTQEIWPDSTGQRKIPIWCGRYPIVFGMLTVQKIVKDLEKKSFSGTLFKYSDTLTEKVLPINGTSMGLTAVFSPKHWVGFFTLGFYMK